MYDKKMCPVFIKVCKNTIFLRYTQITDIQIRNALTLPRCAILCRRLIFGRENFVECVVIVNFVLTKTRMLWNGKNGN